MKDKNVAGLLSLFFGWAGIHRFYLGQVGLGIFYVILMPIGLSFLLGLIDAIAFFSMDKEVFDDKYNPRQKEWSERPQSPRETRYRERNSDKEPTRRVAPRTPAPAKKPANDTLKNKGILKYKDYDYDGAIADFEKALELNPNDIAVHFNLACAHSLTENAERAFFHLDRAVALGFTDFKRIKEHDALAFLRVQDNFDNFEANGFRLAPVAAPETPVATAPPPAIEKNIPIPGGDLLDQLQRLGELREKGLLSEEEFASQKRRLLDK